MQTDDGRWDLDILTFVASLAASMRDSQVEVIANYLVQHLGQQSGPDLFDRIKRHRVPGPETFRQSMKAVPAARADVLLGAARTVLEKAKRNGELDRGILALLESRKGYIGSRFMESRESVGSILVRPPKR